MTWTKSITVTTGERFGRLTVTGPSGIVGARDKVEVTCDCGTVKHIKMKYLRWGKSRSCGCILREHLRRIARLQRTRSKRSQEEGGSARARVKPKRSPEHIAWANMLNRCRSPKSPNWCRYGGRGITVCERWFKFKNFLEDMGQRPSDKHSIDRIDNDGNYEPRNCRWATSREQSLNRRKTRRLTHDGETAPLAVWAERSGLSYAALAGRIDAGWAIERALVEPPRRPRAS